MAIACAYCKGEHDTPAQVRQCWQDGGEQDVPTSADDAPLPSTPAFSSSDDDQASVPRRTAAGSAPRRPAMERGTDIPVPRGVAPAGAGPDELGRHLVVAVGGDIAETWRTAERIVIDAATLSQPEHALGRLRQAHHGATRLIIELAVDFDRRPMLMTEAAPYELGPTFAFDREELHHLVWSNSIDGRDPARATWIALDTAVAHGATALEPGSIGDVRLPDGTTAWIDAGPVRHLEPIDGVPVVHIVTVEHGSMCIPDTNVSTADLAPDQLAAVTHAGGGGPDHRASRIGQDAGAHRTGAASADHAGSCRRRRSASWRSTSAPRRRCWTARATCRACRCAR